MFCKFQVVFTLYLWRLVIYSHNFYQDIDDLVKFINKRECLDHAFMILASLVAPTLLNVIWLVIKAILHERDTGCRNVSQKIIEGLLLILFQLKKYLDNILFCVKRICMCRSPNDHEKACLDKFEKGAEFKEYFEDFYGVFPMLCYTVAGLFNDYQDKQIDELSWSNALNPQIYGPISAIMSMMIAIRLRDDGLLTNFLSFVGWFSIFVSRIAVFAVTSSFVGYYLLIPLSLHVLAFTVWVYTIAIDSFRSERAFVSNIRRFFTAILVFLFFGIPSLFLWPMLFQLKQKRRPMKFLLVIILENLILVLICAIRFMFAPRDATTRIIDTTWSWVLTAILVTTVVGSLFIYLYTWAKPELTDRVVRHDVIRGIETKNFGVYYEFFEVLFKLPSVDNDAQDLTELRESDMYKGLFGSTPAT